jgi:hypothetical protein
VLQTLCSLFPNIELINNIQNIINYFWYVGYSRLLQQHSSVLVQSDMTWPLFSNLLLRIIKENFLLIRGAMYVERNFEALSCNNCCGGITNNCYIFWLCVYSCRYPACNAQVPYCNLWHVRIYNTRIFLHYLIKGTIVERQKKIIEHKIYVFILSKNLRLKHFSF